MFTSPWGNRSTLRSHISNKKGPLIKALDNAKAVCEECGAILFLIHTADFKLVGDIVQKKNINTELRKRAALFDLLGRGKPLRLTRHRGFTP